MTIDTSPEALAKLREYCERPAMKGSDYSVTTLALIDALEVARAQRDAEHDRFLTESGAAIFMADLARLRAQLEEARDERDEARRQRDDVLDALEAKP